MITDPETNFVYLSSLLKSKYTDECEQLTSILKRNNIEYGFLKDTKGIWCRDYMPIQIDKDKYVQFKYDPDYLKWTEEDKKTRSDTKKVCKSNNIKPIPSGLVIDGGNVIKSKTKAILTNKIFCENENYDHNKLIDNLSKRLEVEIVIIPRYKGDWIGHSDGYVRFLDEKTVLSNDLLKENKEFQKNFKEALKSHNLDLIEIPYGYDYKKADDKTAIGYYINYLHVKNLIILPVFGLQKDEKAYEQIDNLFKGTKIETLNINKIAEEGGVLNCISWNIKK